MKKNTGILWKWLILNICIRLIQTIITRIYVSTTGQCISMLSTYIHLVLAGFRLATVGKINKRRVYAAMMCSFAVEIFLFLAMFVRNFRACFLAELVLPLISFCTMVFFHPCYLDVGGIYEEMRDKSDEKAKAD